MFNLYKYNIHVLFVLLPKHGGNSSTVIAAGLLRFHPYWVCSQDAEPEKMQL